MPTDGKGGVGMFGKITDMKYVECVIREIVDGCGVFVISVGTVAPVLTAIWLYAVMP